VPSAGVKARIERFWRAVKRLHEICGVPLTIFVDDKNLVDAGERNLQVAIEAVVDVGEALIACMGWMTPKSYRDVGRILMENRAMDKTLGGAFEEAEKLRNILIHNYIYLPPEDVYGNIGELKDSLTAIMNSIIDHMQSHGIDP